MEERYYVWLHESFISNSSFSIKRFCCLSSCIVFLSVLPLPIGSICSGEDEFISARIRCQPRSLASAFMLISLLGYLWPAWTQANLPLYFEILSAHNVWASWKIYCIIFNFRAIIYCCLCQEHVVLTLVLATHHKFSGILTLFHFWICHIVTCGNLSVFYVPVFQSACWVFGCHPVRPVSKCATDSETCEMEDVTLTTHRTGLNNRSHYDTIYV